MKLEGGGKYSPAIVDGLRGKRLPLVVLSEGKRCMLSLFTEGKHWLKCTATCSVAVLLLLKELVFCGGRQNNHERRK